MSIALRSLRLTLIFGVGAWSLTLFTAAGTTAEPSRAELPRAQPSRAQTRRAEDVFAKWLTWQRIVADVSLSDVPVDDGTVKRLAALPADLKARLPSLKIPGANASKEESAACRDSVQAVLGSFERDPSTFFDLLRKPPFTTAEVEQAEAKMKTEDVTARYRGLIDGLLGDTDEDEAAQVALGNRFFEYAFGERSHGEFRALLDVPAAFPFARLIYTGIWYPLSGNGWRLWHENTLRSLRRESDRGREVVYVAGGSDIYHPIRRGVARLRVIDPLLPTQGKYYSQGWQFLIRGVGPGGGIGDRIVFGKEKITMRRSEFRSLGRFKLGPHEIEESVTVWDIEYRLRFGRRKTGRFVLERRPVRQSDFADTGRAYLISMNELYYVVPADSKNWGIRPEQFPKEFAMHVKQLRRPVQRSEMLNMQNLKEARFSFIRLGSAVD